MLSHKQKIFRQWIHILVENRCVMQGLVIECVINSRGTIHESKIPRPSTQFMLRREQLKKGGKASRAIRA